MVNSVYKLTQKLLRRDGVDFLKLSENLWRSFFSKDWEKTKKMIFDNISPECTIIGTGAHEFYTDLEGFLNSFDDEMADRDNIEFHVDNFWQEKIPVGAEGFLVYGKFNAWGKSENNSVLINMDSRFTFIYHKINEEWKIVHIHQSLPNVDQDNGEYYPKTLLKKVQELQSINEEMTELAQKDSLTNLDNFRSFSYKWEKMNEPGWFFVLDIDHFKQVNDNYGHLTGNEVLKEMAKVFSSAVRSNDLLCRMGGDEFLIFCSGMKDKLQATEFAGRLINDIKKAGDSKPYWTTVSIGASEVVQEMSIESALENADKALYEVKRTKRGGFFTA